MSSSSLKVSTNGESSSSSSSNNNLRSNGEESGSETQDFSSNGGNSTPVNIIHNHNHQLHHHANVTEGSMNTFSKEARYSSTSASTPTLNQLLTGRQYGGQTSPYWPASLIDPYSGSHPYQHPSYGPGSYQQLPMGGSLPRYSPPSQQQQQQHQTDQNSSTATPPPHPGKHEGKPFTTWTPPIQEQGSSERIVREGMTLSPHENEENEQESTTEGDDINSMSSVVGGQRGGEGVASMPPRPEGHTPPPPSSHLHPPPSPRTPYAGPPMGPPGQQQQQQHMLYGGKMTSQVQGYPFGQPAYYTQRMGGIPYGAPYANYNRPPPGPAPQYYQGQQPPYQGSNWSGPPPVHQINSGKSSRPPYPPPQRLPIAGMKPYPGSNNYNGPHYNGPPSSSGPGSPNYSGSYHQGSSSNYPGMGPPNNSSPTCNSPSPASGRPECDKTVSSSPSVSSPLTTSSDGLPIHDETSQQSTLSQSSDRSDGGRQTPKNQSGFTGMSSSYPVPPGSPHSSAPSPGAGSMSSHESGYPRDMASPSWQRTSASPGSTQSRGSDNLSRLYELDDHPDRRIWLDKLLAFMEDKGTPITQCPTISKNPLDLYRLYIYTRERGGYLECTKNKSWKDIAAQLGIGASSSGAYTLKKHYGKNLLAFECYFDRGGLDPGPILAQVEASSKKKAKNNNLSQPPPSPGSQDSRDSYTGSNSQEGYPSAPYPTNAPPYNNYPVSDRPPSHPGYPPGPPVNNSFPYSQRHPGPETYPPPNNYPPYSGVPRPPWPPQQNPYMGHPNGSPGVGPGLQSTSTTTSSMPGGPQSEFNRGNNNPGSAAPTTAPPGWNNNNNNNTLHPAATAGASAAPGASSSSSYTSSRGNFPPGATPCSTSSNNYQQYGDQYTSKMQPKLINAGSSSQSIRMPSSPQATDGGKPVILKSTNVAGPPSLPPSLPPNNHQYSPSNFGPTTKPSSNPSSNYTPKTPPINTGPPSIPNNRGGGVIYPPFSGQRPPMYTSQQPGGYRYQGPPGSPYGPPQERNWGSSGPPRGPGPWGERPPYSYVGQPNGPPGSNWNTMMKPGMRPPYRPDMRSGYIAGPGTRPGGYSNRGREMAFPPGSVEATQPLMIKRRKYNKTDVQPVDGWKLVLTLKSGLLMESTWALDVLNILLHDDNAFPYFGLGNMPGLLEVLLEHWRSSLIVMFGITDDLELHNSTKSYSISKRKRKVSKEEKKEEGDEDDKFNLDIGRVKGIDIHDKVTVLSTENYTKKPRFALEGQEFNYVSKDDTPFITDGLRSWDENCEEFGAESGSEHWRRGGGDSTAHIITHFSSGDLNLIQFVRSLKEMPPSSPQIKEQEISSPPPSSYSSSGIKKENETSGLSLKENSELVSEEDKKEEKGEDIIERIERLTGIVFQDPEAARRRWLEEDLEDENYIRDEPSLHLLSESQSNMGQRCMCISTILRNLTFLPGNEFEFANNCNFLRIAGQLLLLCHWHPPRTTKVRNYDRADEEDTTESCTSLSSHYEWWWDYLHIIRENVMVSLANISGALDLKSYDEDIIRPILSGLLEWAVSSSAYAQDPFPYVGPHSPISPQRLAIESLCKLSLQETNVDLILSTPPYIRIEKLTRLLAKKLYRYEDQVLREFSINLLYYLSGAHSGVARTIATADTTIGLLLGFIEQAEQNALVVAQQHGVNTLRDNPDSMGTSLDMLRRAASTLSNLSRHPDNIPLFLRQEQRLLSLVMSQILDQGVAAILSNVLFHIGEHSPKTVPLTSGVTTK